jgi:sulfur-carrier protein
MSIGLISRGILLAASPSRRYNSVVPTVSRTIRIQVLLFGRLKEVVGRGTDWLDLAEGASMEEAFSHYAARYPDIAPFRESLVAARNQEFAAWNTLLASGDEVAFIPPVSGG